MLHEDRENDQWVFAALRFVNGHCPCESQLGEIRVVVVHHSLVSIFHCHLLLFQINGHNRTQISVEHLSLVIVDLLNNSISSPQGVAAMGQFHFARLWWIEYFLKHSVELSCSDFTACGRRQHLDLLYWIDALLWEELTHEVANALCTQLWLWSL